MFFVFCLIVHIPALLTSEEPFDTLRFLIHVNYMYRNIVDMFISTPYRVGGPPIGRLVNQYSLRFPLVPSHAP